MLNYVKLLNLKKMSQKIYVNFVIKTDEAIRLECQNGINRAEKEIFIVDEKFYFFYAMNRSKKTQTVSLREITKEEYNARKAEILSACPKNGSKEWQDGHNRYALKIFRFGTWKRNMPASDCIFTSENRVRDLMDSVVTQVTMQRESETTIDKESKAEYARRCGGLANKLGISFVNVLRIGPEKGKLMQFKDSYQRALIKAQAIPLKEQRKIYTLLNAGRKTTKEALDLLDIKYFDADVNLMDFSELVKNLWNALAAYSEESVKQAIRNAAEMSYDQRLSIFQKLENNSRELKRAALAELGVDIEIIEFKRYPIERIKKELAATLGIDLA